jgi:hypothetical protein
MPNYDDRGLVALTDNPDGTTRVSVCAGLDQGRPVNVYAEYGSVTNVRVAPGVVLKHSRSGRYIDQVVQVIGEADGVHVRPVAALG